MEITDTQVKQTIKRFMDQWNLDPHPPLWVCFEEPGHPIPIPGTIFDTGGRRKAGMELLVYAELIVLNPIVKPSMMLTTFFHELGHAHYRKSHPTDFNAVDSEAHAIIYSLETLVREGFDLLAQLEASTIKQMAATDEPYKSAVEMLASTQLWQKCSAEQ